MNSTQKDDEEKCSKCKTVVKVPLFLLNLVTWIAGGGLIGLGIWVVTTNNEYKHFAENQHIYIVYMCLSAVLFTAGIFGACGVLVGNKVLLKMYFVMICLVFVVLFGVAVYGGVQRNMVEKVIRKSWNNTSDETRIFFQEKFDCCSIDENVSFNHESNTDDSCFVNTTTKYERKIDCFTKLVEWFEDHLLTIAIFASAIMLLMLALMVASCWLINQLGRSGKRKKCNRVVPISIEQDSVEGNEMTEVEEPKCSRKKTGKKWAKESTRY